MWIDGIYIVDYPDLIAPRKISKEKKKLLNEYGKMMKQILNKNK